MHGRRLPLKMKVAVYKSYVRPVILYESEAWCQEIWKFYEGEKEP